MGGFGKQVRMIVLDAPDCASTSSDVLEFLSEGDSVDVEAVDARTGRLNGLVSQHGAPCTHLRAVVSETVNLLRCFVNGVE